MKKLTLFLLAGIISASVFSQSTAYYVHGKVIDAATKASLTAASIFAQNTTLGTAADAEGNFKLLLPNGGYDLVITFTGYETTTRRVSTTDAADNSLLIELKQKDKEMTAVAVTANNEVKDGWEKYGDFFLENFIGKTINSKWCSINNKEALKFYFSKRKNRLKVLASVPIEITNLALGYKVKYTLDSFTYEYGSQVSTYSGYPFFEELQPADELQRATWNTNRAGAYKGSMLHFMRSVYNKALKEEGFEVQFVAKNNGTETAIPVLNVYGGLNYHKDDSTGVVQVIPNQTDVAVIYKKEEPAEAYLAQVEDAPKKYELSIITFVPDQSIGIEPNGYYFDQNDVTIFSGYWTWEKMGDMLPYDFRIL